MRLTKSQLRKIIKEELKHINPNPIKVNLKPTTVFLFESKNSRIPARSTTLDFLLEQHGKNKISDNHLVASYERSIFWEANILQEDIASAAKEMGKAVIDKIKDWAKKSVQGAIKIMAKGKELWTKGLNILKKIADKVEAWCSRNPILCRAIKVLIIMAIVAAALTLAPNAAQAAEAAQTKVSNLKGTFDIDGTVGMINNLVAKMKAQKMYEPDKLLQMEDHATKILKRLGETKGSVDLDKLQGPYSDFIKSAAKEWIEMKKAALEAGPEDTTGQAKKVMDMANFGKQIVVDAFGNLRTAKGLEAIKLGTYGSP